MNSKQASALSGVFLLSSALVSAQQSMLNVPYVQGGHERHVLDIYAPGQGSARKLPVIFWMHGGGWQAGDKSDVAIKPKVLTERGFVFVSTNYPVAA